MTEFKRYKFSELYEMSSGISSKPEQAGHGFPFASFSTVFNNYFLPEILPDLMDASEREQKIYSIKKGDIFLTRTSETLDELGMSCVAIKDYPKATYSGFVKRLRPLKQDITDERYIGFYLRSKFFRKTMTNNAIMTLRASLNEEIFSYLKLYLPEYKTQKKIGEFLFLLNSKIELNNRINAELEAMAKTLYDYWFVQFDFPNKNGKPYKTGGGKMVWNKELKREIPEGWNNATLLNNSFTLILKPGIKKFSGKKNYLATADINNKEIGLGSEITYLERESRANMQPLKISIWFAKMKNSRKHLFIGQNSYDVINNNILSTGFMGLACNEISFEYLAGYISSDIFEITKDIVSHGATMQGIGNDDLKFFKIVIPNIETLADYKKTLSAIYEKIELGRIENQKLTELRDWLLPMLINGQVQVKDEIEAELSIAAEPTMKYGK
jgi:type I restriction enzyme S subunit